MWTCLLYIANGRCKNYLLMLNKQKNMEDNVKIVTKSQSY